MRKLEDYIEIVGDEVIANIYKKAKKLYGKHILNINSTYQGGGVSEMLVSLVPLMNNIGLDAGWRILHGSPDFFTITKKFQVKDCGCLEWILPFEKYFSLTKKL